MRMFHLKVGKINKIVLALAVVSAGAVLGAYLILSKINSPESYYSVRLAGLVQNMEALDKIIQTGHDAGNLELNLQEYLKIQKDIQKQCREMTEHRSRLESEQLDNEYKNMIDQQEQLCEDLSLVSRYAYDQANALKSYMLLEPLDPAAPDINYARQVSSQTLKSLQQIDNSVIQDPALPELHTLLSRTVEPSEQAWAALAADRNSDVASLVADINKSLVDNRRHLLSARAYFWKNTVRIDAVIRAVERVKSGFEQPK